MDITLETPISLTAASKILPAIDGKRISTCSLWRWCRRGIRGTTLEYVRIGHRICTSAEAIGRFVNRLAQADSIPLTPTPPPAAPRKRTDAQRRKDIAAAERTLKAAGI